MIIEEPTPNLRFLMKGGKRILQQRWIIKEIVDRMPKSITQEWRDVPLAEGE
jgi:hypothetical protein